MKYLKLIEGFNESEYYVKITPQEWGESIGLGEEFNQLKISDVDYEKIKSLFNGKPFSLNNKLVKSTNYGNITTNEHNYIKIVSNPLNKTFNWNIRIYKIEDDYWLVDIDCESSTKGPKDYYNRRIHTRDYFKCDQLEGLLLFLEQKVINYDLSSLYLKSKNSQEMYISLYERKITTDDEVVYLSNGLEEYEGKYVNITDKEFEKLRQYLKQYPTIFIKKSPYYSHGSLLGIRLGRGSERYWLTLKKIEDDYWITSDWYKCDQWDGLIKYLDQRCSRVKKISKEDLDIKDKEETEKERVSNMRSKLTGKIMIMSVEELEKWYKEILS